MAEAGVRYTLGRLILCEGVVDVAFVERLIIEHSLRRSHVRHSGGKRWERGGKSKFAQALTAANVNPTFRKTVKEVVLIADSDDDPARAFQDVLQQLQRAGFSQPPAPRQWSNGEPKTAVFLLPPNAIGSLETYVRDAAAVQDLQLAAFVDDFVALAAMNWDLAESHKLWLRTFISGRNRRDPSASTFRIISNNDPAVINFHHNSLNGLVAFLR